MIFFIELNIHVPTYINASVLVIINKKIRTCDINSLLVEYKMSGLPGNLRFFYSYITEINSHC